MAIDLDGWIAVRKNQLRVRLKEAREDQILHESEILMTSGKLQVLDEISTYLAFGYDTSEQLISGIGNELVKEAENGSETTKVNS